jgi:class 3 adenylate cyclase
MRQAGLLSLLAVPLLRDGRILGGLAVFRKSLDAFPQDSVELLRTFAIESALAIQNARLFRALEEQGQQLAAQAEQLAKWNHTLEQRVHDQVTQLERMGRLKRFFSPQLADVIVSTGSEQLLESHRREITVFFCDLRGFTAFAESADPEEVMHVLHEYHTVLGTLIFQFEGTLEHFAGDGLMVFFNDPLPCPDPAARAVRMAVAVRQEMQALAARWRQRGHQLAFGMGIAQGYATLGMIGFEGRVDYGAIGPVTNLASRLCDEAKGGQILISHRVYTEVQHLIQTESVGEVSFKGFARPMPVFNVLDLKEHSTA